MKTIVPCIKLIRSLSLFTIGLLAVSFLQAQTYTTIRNGAWSSASTWQGGAIPNASNIPATAVVNIRHIVTYSGGSISNLGTININNPAAITARLIVASGVNITNGATGKIYIINSELRQYRFAGGGESGTTQTGNFINNAGYVQVNNSFVEIAQDWTNQTTGTVVFRNSSLVIGRNYDLKNSAIDTLEYTSVSIGMHGSGDYTVDGLSAYFKSSRFQVASSGGKFNLKSGIANGSIDYIMLKNHVNGTYSNDRITAASALVTTGLTLNAYCITDPTKYEPNGKITGTQTRDCSLNYFPAGLVGSQGQTSLNLSNSPVLIAGTDRQVGAQYKYEGAAPGMDVIVKIDSLIGGATISVLDDNTAGSGFIEGFQPQIRSGSIVGKSYAVFTFSYKITGTNTTHTMSTFSLTALDIDGTSSLKEFDEIGMGPGATAAYVMSNPSISLTEVTPGTFRGINVNGSSVGGVDTSAKEYMFTVTNSNVSSFTLKMGMETTSPSSSTRLYSIYMKGFAYPSMATLPLELFSFNALLNKTKTDLKWTTLWEKNVSHFEIQRSVDGKEYRQIAAVFAAGNSYEKLNYSFSDNDISNISSGIIYYRLKLMDIDGKYSYSPVRVIRIGKQNESVKVMTYPNPVVNELRITVPSEWQGKEVKYEVYNASGKMVYTSRNAGASQTEVINMSGLGKGFYVVKVMMGTEVAQQKIIKN